MARLTILMIIVLLQCKVSLCIHGLKFYIYQNGEWASLSQISTKPRAKLEIELGQNGGAGVVRNLTGGLYRTDQYHMYDLVFHRALKDPRRTLNPAEATTFFIPYDFASDCAYYKEAGKLKGKSGNIVLRKCPLAKKVGGLLK